MKERKPGHIVAAAIKIGDSILTGQRHAYLIREAVKQGWEKPIRQDEQGFVDEFGQYFTRSQARMIAIEHKQIKPSFNGVLLSEDLW